MDVLFCIKVMVEWTIVFNSTAFIISVEKTYRYKSPFISALRAYQLDIVPAKTAP